MRIGEHRDDLTLRVRLLSIATMSALGVLAVSFWFVQGVRGKYYPELAENNRLRDVPIRAPRGLIYDRHGRLLVENLPSYNLLLDRARAAEPSGRPAVRRRGPRHGRSRTSTGARALSRDAALHAGAPRREPDPRSGGALRDRGARASRSSRSRSATCASTARPSSRRTSSATSARSAPTTSRAAIPPGRPGRQEGRRAALRRHPARHRRRRVVVVDSRGRPLEEARAARRRAGRAPCA